MDIDNEINLDCAPGSSGVQKRQQPEPETSTGPLGEAQKKTKIDEGPEENAGDLSHLVHAELDHLRSIIDSDNVAKRITISLRKELFGSYNRICSVVRDITYQHAKMAGAYKEMIKNYNKSNKTLVTVLENEGSYVNALQSHSKTNDVLTKVPDEKPSKEPSKRQKGRKGKSLQPNVISAQAPELVSNDIQSSKITKTTTGRPFPSYWEEK